MSEAPFYLSPRATPEVIAERNALADEVCRELVRAGLPARRGDLEDDPPVGPGADVHVDPLAEGGVYVGWATGAELRTTAIDIFAQGIDYTNPPPVVLHYESVQKLMRNALLGILASAGFRVEEPDPYTHGNTVRVTARQP